MYFFDETINHIFVDCNHGISLWTDFKNYCHLSFALPVLHPQSATFGFFDIDPELFLLLNHILLLYKYYIYSSRNSKKLSLSALVRAIKKVFVLEKHLSVGNTKRYKAFRNKWRKMMFLNDFST